MLLVMSMLSAASMLVQTPDIGPRWPNGLGSCYCSTTLPGDTAHPAGYCPDPVECGGAFPTQGTAGWPEVPARLQPETFYSACEAALWSAYIDKRRAAEEAYHDCIDGSGNANRKIVLAYPNQPYPCITPGGTTPGYPWYNNCNNTTDAPDCRYGVYFPCDVISSCWDTLIATLDAAYAEYRHLVFTTCEGLACDYAEDGSLLYPTLGPVAGDTPSSSCYLTYVSCMQDAYDVYAAAVAVSQGDCDLIDAAGLPGGVATFTNQGAGAASTPVTQTAVKAAALAVDSTGWTVFKKSADTRVIYVSSSGDDRNDGLSESRPKKTIAAGYALLRHGYPDWLLLKAGDRWNEGLGRWEKSGRSPTERMMVGTYGTSRARPLMVTGARPGLQHFLGGNTPTSVDNLAFVSLSFSAAGRPAANGPSGFSWLDGGRDILLEDCAFEGYQVNVSVQGFRGQVTNFAIRRSIVKNAYDTQAHAQGLFASKVDGLSIEECLFDHNGWMESVPGADATLYNHSIYVQVNCGPAVLKNNFIFRSSSHGAQLRSGGEAIGNIFVRNPLALLLGGGDSPVDAGVMAVAKGNVILEGSDISPTQRRGFGIDLKNIRGGEVSGNTIAGKLSENSAFAIGSWVSGGPVGLGVQNLTISQNRIVNWRGGIQFIDPGTGSYSGVVVSKNTISSTIPNDAATLMCRRGPLTGVTFVANQYGTLTPVRAFDLSGQRVAFSAWSVGVGESGAMINTSPQLAAMPTFASAMSQASRRTLTFEQAVSLLGSRVRKEWPSAVTPQRMAAALK